MKATVNSAIFNYSAYFEHHPKRHAVGTVDAKSLEDAKGAVYGMCGEWFTEDGRTFSAGCPTVVDVWRNE